LSGVRYFAFAKNIANDTVLLIADRYLFCIFSSLTVYKLAKTVASLCTILKSNDVVKMYRFHCI